MSGFVKVEQFRAAQRLLTQQRYQFPNSWLYSENVDGEWSALSDILERKDSAIQAQVYILLFLDKISCRAAVCRFAEHIIHVMLHSSDDEKTALLSCGSTITFPIILLLNLSDYI